MINYERLNNEMVRNRYTILYYFRKSKRDPSHGTIYGRLTLNGAKIELCCTGIYTNFKNFDPKRQRIKDSELNGKLTRLTAQIIYFIEQTPSPTVQVIKALVNGKSSLNPSILDLMNMYLEHERKNYASGTVINWEIKIDKLKRYLTEKNNLNMEARRFGIQAYNQLRNWIINDQKCSHNLAGDYGLVIRKALRWGVMQGHLSENPLRDLEVKLTKTENLTHLAWEWVVALRATKFRGGLKKAVDLYIFSCCTGICYADIMNLKAEHIEHDPELGLIITNKRQKVSSTYCTPLRSFAREIYESFGSLEAIPKITSQRANKYIKEALERINYPNADKITFHTARKTFVNHCLNNLLIPPHIIMKYTGHQDVKEINTYGRVNRNTSTAIFILKEREYNERRGL